MLFRVIFYLFYSLAILSLEWTSAVIGWRWLRKGWPPAYKLLVALTCVTVVVETLSFLFMLMHIKYDGVYNVWAFVETGIILCIQFLGAIRTWAKRLFMALLVVLSIGTVVCYILASPAFAKMNLPLLLFSLFVQLIGVCIALIDLLQDTSDKPLSVRPAFWFNIGMLFYCSLFTLGHILGIYSVNEATKYYIYFSLVANTCMYGGIITCFKTLRRELPSLTRSN